MTATNRFGKEYPEFFDNPGLYDAVNARTIIERNQDPNASIWDIIDRSAKHVKRETAKALGIDIPVGEEDATPPLENANLDENKERANLKRDAGSPVKSSISGKAPLTPPGRPVLSPFQQLQQARGQGH